MTRISRKPHLLAEFAENTWSLKDYNLFLYIEKNNQGGHIFELKDNSQVCPLHAADIPRLIYIT